MSRNAGVGAKHVRRIADHLSWRHTWRRSLPFFFFLKAFCSTNSKTNWWKAVLEKKKARATFLCSNLCSVLGGWYLKMCRLYLGAVTSEEQQQTQKQIRRVYSVLTYDCVCLWELKKISTALSLMTLCFVLFFFWGGECQLMLSFDSTWTLWGDSCFYKQCWKVFRCIESRLQGNLCIYLNRKLPSFFF